MPVRLSIESSCGRVRGGSAPSRPVILFLYYGKGRQPKPKHLNTTNLLITARAGNLNVRIKVMGIQPNDGRTGDDSKGGLSSLSRLAPNHAGSTAERYNEPETRN